MRVEIPPQRPESLEVVGFVYPTHFVAEEHVLLEGNRGMCYPQTQQIFVSLGENQQTQRQTLLHETLHACEDAAGVELSEEVIENLSRVLFAVGRSNPQAMRWIFEGGSQ